MISLDLMDLNRRPSPTPPRRIASEGVMPQSTVTPQPTPQNPVIANPANGAGGISNLLRGSLRSWSELGMPATYNPFTRSDIRVIQK